MCLRGLLGAERETLPDAVAATTSAYFRMLVDYPSEERPKGAAFYLETAVAALEGGLILARSLGNAPVLEKILDGNGCQLV